MPILEAFLRVNIASELKDCCLTCSCIPVDRDLLADRLARHEVPATECLHGLKCILYFPS